MQRGNVIGRLFNAREGENNFSIDTYRVVMVVKSSECFPKGGIKRNVSLDFRTEIEAVLSLPSPRDKKARPALTSPRLTNAYILAIREFAVPDDDTTSSRYSNTVITLHTYTRYVLRPWRRNNVTDRQDSRHAAHNAITCAKLWDIFARVFSASTWGRQIMMSYRKQCVTFARAYICERKCDLY